MLDRKLRRKRDTRDREYYSSQLSWLARSPNLQARDFNSLARFHPFYLFQKFKKLNKSCTKVVRKLYKSCTKVERKVEQKLVREGRNSHELHYLHKSNPLRGNFNDGGDAHDAMVLALTSKPYSLQQQQIAAKQCNRCDWVWRVKERFDCNSLHVEVVGSFLQFLHEWRIANALSVATISNATKFLD